jgi:hypothetical protein
MDLKALVMPYLEVGNQQQILKGRKKTTMKIKTNVKAGATNGHIHIGG